jgi:hypothetical protein
VRGGQDPEVEVVVLDLVPPEVLRLEGNGGHEGEEEQGPDEGRDSAPGLTSPAYPCAQPVEHAKFLGLGMLRVIPPALGATGVEGGVRRSYPEGVGGIRSSPPPGSAPLLPAADRASWKAPARVPVGPRGSPGKTNASPILRQAETSRESGNPAPPLPGSRRGRDPGRAGGPLAGPANVGATVMATPASTASSGAPREDAQVLEMARLQLDAGAAGLTVATPREAEVMARVCDDLLLAHPPVGPKADPDHGPSRARARLGGPGRP